MFATVTPPYGILLWIGALILAIVTPPVFFVWRANGWRLTLRTLLLTTFLIGVSCWLLKDDLEHFDQAVLFHVEMATHQLWWWGECVLLPAGLCVLSIYSTRKIMGGKL